MATTATVATLKTMRHEVSALEADISREKVKLSDAETELAALGIEKGACDTSKIAGIVAKIAVQEEIIRRLRDRVRPRETRRDELWALIRRAESEERTAAPLREIDAIKAKGEAIIADLERKITAAIGDDLNEYRRIRERLTAYVNTSIARSYPIPAPAQAADRALKTLNDKLVPILGKLQGTFLPRR